MLEVKIMDFVACDYDMHWWIGLLEDINREKKDRKTTFMHPLGSLASFCWPVMDDICWVPFDKPICKIEAPENKKIRIQDTMKIITLLNH